MKRCAGLCLVLLFTSLATAHAAEAAAQAAAVRELAVQLKRAVDQAEHGTPPSADALSTFERVLGKLHADSNSAEPPQRKLATTAALFARLRLLAQADRVHLPARPAAVPARPDAQIVSADHGASCSTALGLSTDVPVRVILGGASERRNDAWLRLSVPPATRAVRIATDSATSDPALTVFGNCDTSAPLISNDDASGLDAALLLGGHQGEVIYIHLTNSGDAGAVVISATPAAQTVNGVVRDAKTTQPIGNAQVELLDGNGGTFGYDYTDQNGVYSIAATSPGTYYVVAINSYHVTTLFPNAPCRQPFYFDVSSCDTFAAQQVSVVANTATQNINILMSPGQKILGQVRDANNQPLYQATISLYDGAATNTHQGSMSAYTDASGHFAFSTLANGNYKLTATRTGYGAQMYSQVACPGSSDDQCDLNKANKVSVTSQDVTGVNFNLPVVSTISGSVRDAHGAPLNGQVYVLDSSGYPVTYGYSNNFDGGYSFGPLANGTYYIYASVYGYFSQLFGNVDCAGDCSQNLAGATAISITFAGQQAHADFALNQVPVVRGHVQDAISGLPLAHAGIAVIRTPPATNPYTTSSGFTDASGDYSIEATPTGSYYLWATIDDHVDQIYPALACEATYNNYNSIGGSCDVTGAVLLTIAPGQALSSFDFALNPSSRISGKAITRAGPGSNLRADVTIDLYNTAGAQVGSTQPDALGNYAMNDVAPGTYFMAAETSYSSNYYVYQVWQQIDCNGSCVPTTGTAIFIPAAGSVSGIDFLLTQRGAVTGRVTDQRGNPVGGAEVDFFAGDTKQFSAFGIANADGYYAVAANGSYYVATEAGAHYVDQAYSGVACPLGPVYYGLCSLNGATPVTLNSSSTQARIIDFMLAPNDRIFANAFE